MRKKNMLLVILALAVLLRFHGMNWDEGSHLHPDERFLSMVVTASKIPKTFHAYMDPSRSMLNPSNIGFPFYVYGIFPVSFTKVAAMYTNNDSYGDVTELGRGICAFLDLLTLIFVYKFCHRLQLKYGWDENIPLLAAFFYAISVLPIQISHFYTVDPFLNFFMISSFYCVYRFAEDRKIYRVAVGALLFGLAMSSKVTAIFILPVIAYSMATAYFPREQWHRFTSADYWKSRVDDIFDMLFCMFLFCILAAFATRVLNPYMFSSTNIFDFKFSKEFTTNIDQLKALTKPDTWFPPSIQWLSKKPVIFSLVNIAYFGLGIPYYLCMLAGIFSVLLPFRSTKRFRNHMMVVIALWMLAFFLYQSTAFVKVMRYFIFLYPFFAVFAAIGFMIVSKRLGRWGKVAAVVALLTWPVAFSSLYNTPHTRIAASRWIGKNVPKGSVILSEYWDDALPLPLKNVSLTDYTGAYIYPFDRDTPDKWKRMADKLAHADYLVLSSNRGWGSIMAVPERYPRQSAFYRDLLAGRLLYKKVAEFTSYPSLRYVGIPLTFPDDWADESFTVYDHPHVMIFKNERPAKQ